MTCEEIIKKVQNSIILAMPILDASMIQMDTHLRDDLGADSVDKMAILIAIEAQFQISIPVENTISTVEQIVDAIEKMVNTCNTQEAAHAE